MDAARTDVLTVERQMVDHIEGRLDDRDFCWRLQLFLQGEGATFDLPVERDPALDGAMPPAPRRAPTGGRLLPGRRRIVRFTGRRA